jgi:hypothetical protein
VGINRQVAGKRGEKSRRYKAIRPRRILTETLREPFPMIGREAREESCPPKELSQNPPKALRIRFRNFPMGNQEKIEALRHLGAMQAKVFPHPPLDAAADHRPSNPSTHGQTEASPRVGPLVNKKIQSFEGKLFSASDDLAELFGTVNAIALGKSIAHPGLDPAIPPGAFSPSLAVSSESFAPLASASAGETRGSVSV